MTAGRALANLEAYDLWAASYPPVPHNPLMRAEQRAMQQLWPAAASLNGARALDLACGSGRYTALLRQSGASHVVAMDLSLPMLQRIEGGSRVRGDMECLPFGPATFDAVVSGLAVGHAYSLDDWVGGIVRILVPDGLLLYSDFHPDAAQAGMTRSFTDSRNRRHTLLHHRHEKADHHRVMQAAGLEIEAMREVRVGLELNEGFAGADAFYRRWHGLPVVLAVRARKLHHA